MAGSSWPTFVAGARAKASEVEAKFDWVEQDIVPMSSGTKTDNTYDLGAATFRWRNCYLGPGSVGTNALSIRSADMGIYSSSISTLNISVSGTSVMQWNADGIITIPKQCAFAAIGGNANANTNQSITSLNTTTVQFGYEQFDVNSDFNNATGIFTAPVSGKYQFNINLHVQFAGTTTIRQFGLVASNRTWSSRMPDTNLASSWQTDGFASFLIDMDQNDTAYVYSYADTGTTILGTGNLSITSASIVTFFSGFLMG